MASPDKKSFLLRIDPKLWVELETWAQRELRSVNGQIEFVLREAVARRKKSSGASGAEVPGGSPPSPQP